MLKNVNKLQIVDACLYFLASKCPLTHVVMYYKANQVDSSIPIGTLSRSIQVIIQLSDKTICIAFGANQECKNI